MGKGQRNKASRRVPLKMGAVVPARPIALERAQYNKLQKLVRQMKLVEQQAQLAIFSEKVKVAAMLTELGQDPNAAYSFDDANCALIKQS